MQLKLEERTEAYLHARMSCSSLTERSRHTDLQLLGCWRAEGQDGKGQGRAGQDRTGKDRTGRERTGREGTGQHTAGHVKTHTQKDSH